MSNSDLRYLGKQVRLPACPEQAALDRIDNPHQGQSYLVRLSAPEFTCLCPVTGQPDFAHFVIDYVPGEWLVESRSFKLFLASFRNEGRFHEDSTVYIGRRLQQALEPVWIRVCGFWYPRGGIPIDVFWSEGECPDVYVPEPGVSPYRGRG